MFQHTSFDHPFATTKEFHSTEILLPCSYSVMDIGIIFIQHFDKYIYPYLIKTILVPISDYSCVCCSRCSITTKNLVIITTNVHIYWPSQSTNNNDKWNARESSRAGRDRTPEVSLPLDALHDHRYQLTP